MKEEGKKSTNLLIPLGIGAGLLLLFSMKKKDDKTPATTPADAPAIPQIKSEEAAVPQITPDQAPQYTLPDTQAKSAAEEEENSEDSDTEQSETTPSDQEESSNESASSSSSEEDSSDESDAASGSGSSNRSSGGGYTPSNSINANARTTAPANSSTKWDNTTQQRAAMQRKRNNDPRYIGNGKPRMGVQQPVAYRPGASNVNPATNTTNAAQHSIMIARNPHAARPTVKKQATIFPLQMGHRNAYVKEVQRRIGVSPTGFFGAQTRAALQQRYGVTAISETLYKQIITGKAPVTAVATAKRPHAAPLRKNRKPIHKKGKPHVIRK